MLQSCGISRSDYRVVEENCPARPYLELQVPVDAARVVTVCFTITSHDQGFTSEGEIASYSTFDAAVRVPGGNNGFQKLHICTNRLGVGEFGTASITWDGAGPQKAWVNALRAGDVIQLIPSAIYLAWANVIKEAHIRIEYERETGPTQIPQARTSLDNSVYCNLPLGSPSRDIRLLELDAGEYEDALSGRFLLHRLMADCDASGHEFHALSYCWGRSEDRYRIGLRLPMTGDTAPAPWFTVQREVYEALKRLRRRHEPLRIWVDAICINQLDEDERTRQVNIMGEIYSRAKQVHIWLGEDQPGVKAALRFIHDAYNYNEGTCLGAAACTCGPTGHTVDVETLRAVVQRKKNQKQDVTFKSLHELFDLYEPHMQPDVYASLGIQWNSGRRISHNYLTCHFFSRPWFSRVWVLQEALLARNATIQSGKEAIDWKEVVAVNSYLSSYQFQRQGPHFGPQTCMPRVWASVIESKAADDVGRLDSLKRRFPVLKILLEALDMKASDARDKLFALLSFAIEASPSNDVHSALQPNYDEANSARRVFANFTRWHIYTYESLEVLSTVHYQPTRTWQRILCDIDPRINEAIPTPSWSFGIEGDSKWLNATIDRQFDFKAGGDTVPDRRLLNPAPDALYLLSLRGVRLATITAITKAPVGYDEEYKYDGTERTDSKLVLVFSRIFDPAGNAGHWNWISCPIVGSDPDSIARRFNSHFCSHWNLAEEPRQVEVAERYWTTLDCVDDCFFQASKGFKGLCPWSARDGDLIVLLYGGNVPYLLRLALSYEAGDHYFLVGECYVNDQGVMDGSYLNGLVGGDFTAAEEALSKVFILE